MPIQRLSIPNKLKLANFSNFKFHLNIFSFEKFELNWNALNSLKILCTKYLYEN
jgi:hypothetical protein